MESIFQNDFSVALLGVLIILALWMAVRYFIKSKSRIGIKSHQVPISAVIKRPSQAMIDNAPTVAATLPNKVAEEATDDDSILEEAELYSNHGRPAGAIKILLEVINRHPSKAAAWSLLLSNYSSLGQVDEFEKTAREFLKHHNSSPLWNGIQALGRTLDRDNPLYDSNNGNAYSSPPCCPTRQIRAVQ